MRTIADIQAQLNRIAAHRARMVDRRNVVATELESAQLSAREKFFGGDGAAVVAELVEKRARLEVEADLIEATLTRLNADQLAAERDLRAAEIAQWKAEAAAKRAEVERLHERAAPLLKKLGDIVGIELGIEVLSASRDPIGQWQNHPASPAGVGVPVECQNPTEALALCYDRNNLYRKPKTRLLLEQARELEKQAAMAEAGLLVVDTDAGTVIVKQSEYPNLTRAELAAQLAASQPPARTVVPGSADDPLATVDDRVALLKKRRDGQ